MTDTTARRIRIESNLDTDRKTHALHHTKIYADDQDITNDVIAIDWHADAKSIPTATIQIYSPSLHAEAAETEAIHGELITAEPDTRIDDLTDEVSGLRAQLDTATQQLQQLQQLIIQTSPQCATCATEHRQGTRPAMNLVNVIIDGTGYCHEHVDLVSGRLVPKKTSGLIITGG